MRNIINCRDEVKIDGIQFLKYIGFPVCDFSRQLFAIYEKNQLTWNEYFQFVMMISTSNPEQLIKCIFKFLLYI